MESVKTIKKAIELLKQRNQMLEASKIKAMETVSSPWLETFKE